MHGETSRTGLTVAQRALATWNYSVLLQLFECAITLFHFFRNTDQRKASPDGHLCKRGDRNTR